MWKTLLSSLDPEFPALPCPAASDQQNPRDALLRFTTRRGTLGAAPQRRPPPPPSTLQAPPIDAGGAEGWGAAGGGAGGVPAVAGQEEGGFRDTHRDII